MTTVITPGTDSGGNAALMFFLTILVVAALGFGIYYFSGMSTHTSTNTTINMPEAPKAPSLPEVPAVPAPALPTPAE